MNLFFLHPLYRLLALVILWDLCRPLVLEVHPVLVGQEVLSHQVSPEVPKTAQEMIVPKKILTCKYNPTTKNEYNEIYGSDKRLI